MSPMFDISHWFVWKSKAEREQEAEEYAEWAFPYGEQQRENLAALMKAVFPKSEASLNMVKFLSCRELYEKELRRARQRDVAIDGMLNNVKKIRGILKENEMAVFMALVLANAEVDKDVEYPSAQFILTHADELRLLRNEG